MSIVRHLGVLLVGFSLLLSLGACVIQDHGHGYGRGHYNDRPPGHWRR
jgi:hypothetical protein